MLMSLRHARFLNNENLVSGHRSSGVRMLSLSTVCTHIDDQLVLSCHVYLISDQNKPHVVILGKEHTTLIIIY